VLLLGVEPSLLDEGFINVGLGKSKSAVSGSRQEDAHKQESLLGDARCCDSDPCRSDDSRGDQTPHEENEACGQDHRDGPVVGLDTVLLGVVLVHGEQPGRVEHWSLLELGSVTDNQDNANDRTQGEKHAENDRNTGEGGDLRQSDCEDSHTDDESHKENHVDVFPVLLHDIVLVVEQGELEDPVQDEGDDTEEDDSSLDSDENE